MSQAALRLKLVHFRLIDAVADHGQLSRAARALSITQPAASRMLGEIEAIVGAQLFNRTPKGMEPTVIGSALARRALLLMREMRDAGRELEELKSGDGGSVRMGVVTGPAVNYVTPVIAELRPLSSMLELHVEVAPSRDLIPKLRNRDLDFVLGRIPDGVDPRDFVWSKSGGERLAFVAHEDHRLAGRRGISYAELSRHSCWSLQQAGSPIRRSIEDAFRRFGAELPSEIVNTNSTLMALSLCAQAGFVAPLGEAVAELMTSALVGARFVRLDVTPPIRISDYHLLRMRHRMLSPAAEKICSLLEARLG